MAAVLLTTAACTAGEPAPVATGPVSVPAPDAPVDPAAVPACEALIEALPDEIDPGVRRRPVATGADRDAPLAAAWGDPPVVLSCGVPPADRPDEPAQVNGVLWSVRDIGAGFRWTTEELDVTVAVEVPDAYDNGAELVNPLAEPLLRTLAGAPSSSSPSP